ncbi:uncharacterized protein LOC118429779 [Branchiostoma floridae]|uniref:Uncharacterized protein LOC118429779 n=1 Tax=Branchiostoma floridae TaxID=7739 RepID=A0A9J7NB06_BRAFL|nr:uncharacterized protein LOC118429779 [Branchiostoma floridae]
MAAMLPAGQRSSPTDPSWLDNFTCTWTEKGKLTAAGFSEDMDPGMRLYLAAILPKQWPRALEMVMDQLDHTFIGDASISFSCNWSDSSACSSASTEDCVEFCVGPFPAAMVPRYQFLQTVEKALEKRPVGFLRAENDLLLLERFHEHVCSLKCPAEPLKGAAGKVEEPRKTSTFQESVSAKIAAWTSLAVGGAFITSQVYSLRDAFRHRTNAVNNENRPSSYIYPPTSLPDETQGTQVADRMDATMADLRQACYGEYSAKNRRTEEGLRQILQTKYNDNIEEFRQRFVEPTLQLLTTLRNQGIPVSTPKYQLLHMVSPDITYEAGDMFFQVGQSKPGTLSLKFTKYDNVRNVIRLQNLHVSEKDYRTAFTDQYLQDLRTLASNTGNIGDVLMRTCIVITKDGAVARVGTSSIMEDLTNMNVIGRMTPVQKSAIAEKLDKEPVLRTSDDRDDWLALAERIATEVTLEEGFTAKMNASTAPGSPTMKLLEVLGRRDPSYPTARLLDHLRQMGRYDAVDAFNHAKETRGKKDWQRTRSQTVDLVSWFTITLNDFIQIS